MKTVHELMLKAVDELLEVGSFIEVSNEFLVHWSCSRVRMHGIKVDKTLCDRVCMAAAEAADAVIKSAKVERK